MLAAAIVCTFPTALLAASYNLTLNATLSSVLIDDTTRATGCGESQGDTYDDFCPSNNCDCTVYVGKVKGNRTGKSADQSAELHVTHNALPGTPVCRPVFGELIFSASKDTETIYLNGSQCPEKKPGVQSILGGWEIFDSAQSLAALGTFTGTVTQGQSDTVLKLKLSGRTN
jgi:hypothetical protein